MRAEVPGKLIHYAHDGRGRRIGRVVSVGGGAATLDKAWIYGDGLNPIAQLDSSGTMEAVYLYGTRANVPDAIVTATGTYRVVSDHLGSVRMVIDQAGSVVEEWDYDAYGNVVSSAGSTGLHPFGFAGGITDPDTGMVRFGARDYEPGTGKWTSRDPIKFDGGRNLYEYSEHDPVNRLDTSGLESYVCTRPLSFMSTEVGPIHHRYICVQIKGKTTCGGFTPSGNALASPGRRSGKSDGDVPNSKTCKPLKSDNCTDECLNRYLQAREKRLYSVATYQCQDWVKEVVKFCQFNCKNK